MKKKLKYIYRIFGVLLTFVVVAQFFGLSQNLIYYDTLEELQKNFQNYYFFDVELEDKQLDKCFADGGFTSASCFRKKKDNGIEGYVVNYVYSSKYKDKDAEFEIYGNSKTDIENRIEYLNDYGYAISNTIVDNIQVWICFYGYDNNNLLNFNIDIYFKIDNIVYSFYTAGATDNESDQEIIAYFLSIASPAIESRYKPINNSVLY